MSSTLYKATLKSSWSDNDCDIHSDYHNAFIRLYDNGEIISRAGFDGMELDLEKEDSYSLKGHYRIDSDTIFIELSSATGVDESINWTGVEMKYWGELRDSDDFLKAGKYEAKFSDDSFRINDLHYQKTAST